MEQEEGEEKRRTGSSQPGELPKVSKYPGSGINPMESI